MNTGFIEKLIARLDRLSARQVQILVDRLVRERGFLENVFEALQEGVLILDPDGAVTFLNGAASGFFGLDSEHALGQRLDSLVRKTSRRVESRSARTSPFCCALMWTLFSLNTSSRSS